MARELGGVGTKVVFEDDRVRVWDFKLAPGEASPLHSHKHDYLFVYVTEDNRLDIVVPEGRTIEQRSPEGFVAYWEAGKEQPPHWTHTAKNVGDKPHRQILIEFLGPSVSDETRGPMTNGR